jgi:glucosyl-3-phosphoglycerate synthase
MSAHAPRAAPEPRSFHHSLFTPERIATARGQSVSVCLPARECAATVGEVVSVLSELRAQGVLDEIVVIDAASRDGTAELARRAGARVVQESELMPEHGPVLGKGDAMWRALSTLEGELVCYLDADTEAFRPQFACGLIGALVCEPDVSFAKGFYRRPLERPGEVPGEGGGRVNHLLARPALAQFYPELAGVRQPLAGEVAARRDLLESLPFVTGYGVEIAMLIDVWRAVGLGGIAQVDLDEHRNPHKPLSELAAMAHTVLATVAMRMAREGRLAGVEGLAGDAGGANGPVERPALALARAA